MATAARKSTADVARVALKSIVAGDNPREHFDETALQELADSMADVGLLQPIILRKKGRKFELVAGERRLRAARMLDWSEIPARVLKLSDKQAAEVRLLENWDRESLNGIEEAAAIRQLRELGHSPESLAGLLHISADSVASREALLTLPDAWQELVKHGKLSAAAAEYLIPWITCEDVLAEMERSLHAWPMPLTEWKRRLTDAVLQLSRAMDPEDPARPLFTPTDEERERLDIVPLTLRPGHTVSRALNVTLWDELQDSADPAIVSEHGGNGRATNSRAARRNGHARPQGDPGDADGPAETFGPDYLARLEDWIEGRLRELIAERLAGCDLAELRELCDSLGIDPDGAWRLTRPFLQLHNAAQLQALADDLGVDVSDAADESEVAAILMHVQPERIPGPVRMVFDAEPAHC